MDKKSSVSHHTRTGAHPWLVLLCLCQGLCNKGGGSMVDDELSSRLTASTVSKPASMAASKAASSPPTAKPTPRHKAKRVKRSAYASITDVENGVSTIPSACDMSTPAGPVACDVSTPAGPTTNDAAGKRKRAIITRCLGTHPSSCGDQCESLDEVDMRGEQHGPRLDASQQETSGDYISNGNMQAKGRIVNPLLLVVDARKQRRLQATSERRPAASFAKIANQLVQHRVHGPRILYCCIFLQLMVLGVCIGIGTALVGSGMALVPPPSLPPFPPSPLPPPWPVVPPSLPPPLPPSPLPPPWFSSCLYAPNVSECLNRRYQEGRPSSDLGRVGVLVHVDDGMVDKSGNPRDQFVSASIVSASYGELFHRGGSGGFILNPSQVSFLCSWNCDGGTSSRHCPQESANGCVPGCTAPAFAGDHTVWCGEHGGYCPFHPSDLRSMLVSFWQRFRRSGHGYNEVKPSSNIASPGCTAPTS